MAGENILLKVDRSKQPTARITVYSSGQSPKVFLGNGVTFRVMVLDEAGEVADLSNLSNLSLSYMATDRATAAVATETVSINDATFTEAAFAAGTAYHGSFTFTEAEMNPTLSTLADEFWMVCYGTVTATGEEFTQGGGTLTVIEDGTDNTVSSPDPPETGVTSSAVNTQIEAKAVQYDEAQSLSAGEKTQARDNIDAIAEISEDTTPQLGGDLDTDGNAILESKGADVASATALTLGGDGNYYDVTGTTTITSIATLGVGARVRLHFDDALTLTHHATDLILPTGANITTAAGDEAEFVEYATGDWRCVCYQRADGTALGGAATVVANDSTPQLGGDLDTDGNTILESKGADVASATALTLGGDGNFYDITGTTNIESIGTLGVGTEVTLQFDGILDLVHHATNLILPTGSDITTAAGDVAKFREYASGDWVCVSYQRADGTPLTGGGSGISNLSEDTTPQLGGDLDCNSHQLQMSKGADIASANALPLTTDGNYFVVTGTTTISSIDTSGTVGTHIWLEFSGALTLNHSAGLFLSNNASNITTAVGDVAHFVEKSSGNWKLLDYEAADGRALVPGLTELSEDPSPTLSAPLDTSGQMVKWSKGSDIASATELSPGTDGNYFDVTGTTTISSIATSGRVGTVIRLHFDSTPTINHDATNLILPTGANISAEAGDEAEFVEYASGDWRCTNYQRADGSPLASASVSQSTASVIEVTQAGHGLSVGEGVEQADDGTWGIIVPITSGGMGGRNPVGIVTAVPTSGTFTVQIGGNVSGLTIAGTESEGDEIFATTSGGLTTTAATTWPRVGICTGTGALNLAPMWPGDIIQRRVIQHDPSAAQVLTTTYADVDGSSVTFRPTRSTSLIRYAYSFQLGAVGSTGTSGHFRLLVGGTPQTESKCTHTAFGNLDDNFITYEHTFSASGVGSGTVKMQAREYDGTSYQSKLHETYTSDGAVSSVLKRATLVIEEIYDPA